MNRKETKKTIIDVIGGSYKNLDKPVEVYRGNHLVLTDSAENTIFKKINWEDVIRPAEDGGFVDTESGINYVVDDKTLHARIFDVVCQKDWHGINALHLLNRHLKNARCWVNWSDTVDGFCLDLQSYTTDDFLGAIEEEKELTKIAKRLVRFVKNNPISCYIASIEKKRLGIRDKNGCQKDLSTLFIVKFRVF